MNPWDIFFAILGWIAVGIAAFGAFILVFGILWGTYTFIRNSLNDE